ncbi:MAG: universal stress protein, partial [Polyangiaceae bacterium]
IATDFSDCSARALDIGVELAQQFDAQLTLVHTWEIPSLGYGAALYFPGDVSTPIEQAAQSQLNATTKTVQERIPRAKSVLRAGIAWDEILAAAESTHADLIVLGTHGRRGFSRALLGSVAERVVRLSPVAVLTVRGT